MLTHSLALSGTWLVQRACYSPVYRQFGWVRRLALCLSVSLCLAPRPRVRAVHRAGAEE